MSLISNNEVLFIINYLRFHKFSIIGDVSPIIAFIKEKYLRNRSKWIYDWKIVSYNVPHIYTADDGSNSDENRFGHENRRERGMQLALIAFDYDSSTNIAEESIKKISQVHIAHTCASLLCKCQLLLLLRAIVAAVVLADHRCIPLVCSMYYGQCKRVHLSHIDKQSLWIYWY